MLVALTGCTRDEGDGAAAAPTTARTATPTTLAAAAPEADGPGAVGLHVQEFEVPAGSHPHDVAVARDGTVWYTGQASGELGRLDRATGAIQRVNLGRGSRP